jgi:hypothetical protein
MYITGCRRAAISKYIDRVATSYRQLQEKAEAEAEVEVEVDVVARYDNCSAEAKQRKLVGNRQAI